MKSISMIARSKIVVLGVALLVAAAVPVTWAQSKRTVTSIRVDIDESYLGIEMEDVTADNMATYKLTSERGVIVRSVEKGSPAEAGNLLEKDVILEYAGTPVFSTQQFARLVRETPAGRKVDLVVSRDGKKLNLTAKIGKREGSRDVVRRGLVIEPRDFLGREFRFEGPGSRSFSFGIPDSDAYIFRSPDDWLVRVPGGKPRLGVTLEPLTDQMGEFLGVPGKKGTLVTSVIEGSPAASRLKAGDVIVRADNSVIEGPDDLIRVVNRKEADSKMELKVIRDKKEISVSVELKKEGEKPKPTGFRL